MLRKRYAKAWFLVPVAIIMIAVMLCGFGGTKASSSDLNKNKNKETNLLSGLKYMLSTAPNGTNKDHKRKLTDGKKNFSVSEAVQWDFGSLPSAEITISFDLGMPKWVSQLSTYWSREDSGLAGPGPETVRWEGSLDGTNWSEERVLAPVPENIDADLNVFEWKNSLNEPVRYIRMIISRESFHSGIVSLNEIEAFAGDNAAARDYTLSPTPTGQWKDQNGKTLIDGSIGPHARAVEWNMAQLGSVEPFVNIQYDLGQNTLVHQVDTVWIGNEAQGKYYPDDVTIEASIDGNDWKKIGVSVKERMIADETQLYRWYGKPYTARYIRVIAHRSIGNNAATQNDPGSANPHQGIIALQEVAIFRDSGMIPAQPINVLSGKTDYQFSIAPNTPRTDTAPVSMLTDGEAGFDLRTGVEWDFGKLDGEVYVQFDLGSLQRLNRLEGLFLRNEQSQTFAPDAVAFEYSANGMNWSRLTARDGTLKDDAVGTWRWNGTRSVEGRYIRIVFDRQIARAGIVSLLEVRAFPSASNVSVRHNEFGTAYVYSIIAGNDVYFRPNNGVPSSFHFQPPDKESIVSIVRSFHENYGANTLYVQYNGELSRTEALDYYGKWFEAGKMFNVRIVPAIGLIQFDYLQNHPEDEYLINGNRNGYFGLAPLLDLRKQSAKDYFTDFLKELQLLYPGFERVGVWDNNQFPLARSLGYNFTNAEIEDWIDALKNVSPGKQHVMVFQQPYAMSDINVYPWLAKIDGVLMDTYGFVRNAHDPQMQQDLANYVAHNVSQHAFAEADLVPGNDEDDLVTAGENQRIAAEIIKQNGGEISLDVIIHATKDVTSTMSKRDFWGDLAYVGYYDGFLIEPWEQVRDIFWEMQGDDYKLVKEGELPEFQLTSPANGVVEVSGTPTFQWESAGGPGTTYTFLLDEYPDFSSLAVFRKANLTTTSYTPDVELEEGKTYYWKVIAAAPDAGLGLKPSASAYHRFSTLSNMAALINYAYGMPYTKSIEPLAGFPDTNGREATDGIISSGNYTDGKSYAYHLPPGETLQVDLTVDLGELRQIGFARFHSILPSGVRYYPDEAAIYTSADGTSWTDSGRTQQINDEGWMTISFPAVDARYVKFSLEKTRVGAVDDFLFLDELEVYRPIDPNESVKFGSPLGTFALISPAKQPPLRQANALPLKPTLEWEASTGATSYEVMISTNADFTNPVYMKSGVTATSHQVDTPLAPSTVYYWKVIAMDDRNRMDSWMGLNNLPASFETRGNALRGKMYSLDVSPMEQYGDQRGKSVDGIIASHDVSDGLSYGYRLNDIGDSLTVRFLADLGASQTVSSARFHGILSPEGQYLPNQVDVYLSMDGNNWSLAGSVESADSDGWMIADFPAYDARWVKFELSKTRAANEDEYLFIDEIEIY